MDKSGTISNIQASCLAFMMLKIRLKTETCVWGLNILRASVGFPGTQGCKIAQVIMLVKSWPYPEFFVQKHDLNTQTTYYSESFVVFIIDLPQICIHSSDEIQYKRINK